MHKKFLNWTTAGLVAAALTLPSSTASAQRSRGDAPATGGAVARDPAPAPPAPAPAPAAPASGGGRSDGGSVQSGGDSGQSRGGQRGGRTRSRAGAGNDQSGARNGDGRDGSATASGRSRGDRPVTGEAVPRRPGSGNGGGGGSTIIVPGGGYFPWGWGGLGFGGYYGGYYGGLYDPWGYDPYQGGGGGYSYGSGDDGSLRLKVKPRDASVYIDGYFAGTVDEFDGVFQRLHIDSGPHRIEVQAEGYEPLTFEVDIRPDRSVTYKGELQKLP
jgi:hypothetical protein